jgi:hypothetical protein
MGRRLLSFAIPCIVLSILFSLGFEQLRAEWINNGTPICTALEVQDQKVVLPDGNGGAFLVWYDARNWPFRTHYAQKIDVEGGIQWPVDGLQISPGDICWNFPRFIADGEKGILAAYLAERDADYTIFAAYVQKVDEQGLAQWPDSGILVRPSVMNQTHQVLVSDGAGGCIVAWSDKGAGNYDIYAQRIDRNGNRLWTDNGVPICAASGTQMYPRIVSDGAGGAFLSWWDLRDANNHLYVQHVDGDGNILWEQNGRQITTAASASSRSPEVIRVNAGGVIVIWMIKDADSRHLFAQRLDATGNKLWPDAGVFIFEAAGLSLPVWAISDGVEGAIISAEIVASSNDNDVKAQRIDPDGSLLWGENGILMTEAQLGTYPVIDGVGGFYLFWQDNRNGDLTEDIYGQYINAEGNAEWASDGRPICAAESWQTAVSGMSDGEGGAIISWTDNRNYALTKYDIYAARVSSEGAIVATLLQQYAASWSESGVAIDWTLSETGSRMSFTLLRATARDRVYTKLDSREISSDGMRFSFIDRSAEPGASYLYRVEVVDENGRRTLFETDVISVPSLTLFLSQNSPNPFNPSTVIRYYLPEKCFARLAVYDISGARVANLVEREQEKGSHAVEWNGKDEQGNSVASGIYFYRLTAGKETISKKMVMLR